MVKDIIEMLKMILIIFLWIAGYSLSLELIKAYSRSNQECKIETQDFIPSSENTNETLYANCGKDCGKENIN